MHRDSGRGTVNKGTIFNRNPSLGFAVIQICTAVLCRGIFEPQPVFDRSRSQSLRSVHLPHMPFRVLQWMHARTRARDAMSQLTSLMVWLPGRRVGNTLYDYKLSRVHVAGLQSSMSSPVPRGATGSRRTLFRVEGRCV